MGASISSLRRVNSMLVPSRNSSSSGDESAVSSSQGLSQRLLRVPSLRYLKRRRGSVSAESGKASIKTGKRPSIPKTVETCERILQLIKSIAFFQELDENQRGLLVDAMHKRVVKSGEVIIREGQEGDFFYAIDYGTFEASKEGDIKFVYEGSGSFGELALLYNAPRAATVTAKTDGVLWALDRSIFRSLVVEGWQERRLRYDAQLRTMALFKNLTDERRAAIADCLAFEKFTQGDVIISQGDAITSNSKFYIVEDGLVECFRKKRKTGSLESTKVLTRSVGPGDVFGEVALLMKGPRQADCIASSPIVKCLTLSRDAFERLMGPVEQILAKQIEAYRKMNAEERRSTGT